MYLVPILTSPKGTDTLKQYWIFLERNGTHLIQIDPEDSEDPLESARAFFIENELSPAADPFCVGDFVFAPVDHTDKDLAAFYTWGETPPGTIPTREVWRPFLWVGGPADPWGVNKLLGEIPLADPAVSAHTILSSYLTAQQQQQQQESQEQVPP